MAAHFILLVLYSCLTRATCTYHLSATHRPQVALLNKNGGSVCIVLLISPDDNCPRRVGSRRARYGEIRAVWGTPDMRRWSQYNGEGGRTHARRGCRIMVTVSVNTCAPRRELQLSLITNAGACHQLYAWREIYHPLNAEERLPNHSYLRRIGVFSHPFMGRNALPACYAHIATCSETAVRSTRVPQIRQRGRKNNERNDTQE